MIDDREPFVWSSEAEYFFRSIKSTLKFTGSYSISEFKNIVNGSDFRNVKSSQLQRGSELRTGFNNGINFHLGTKWTTSGFTSKLTIKFTNNVSFLDFYFVVNDKIDGQIRSERYDFNNLDGTNVYGFLDLTMRYKIKKDKINLSIKGKNLLNNSHFRNISVTDIGSSITEIRLLPLHVIVNMEYNF